MAQPMTQQRQQQRSRMAALDGKAKGIVFLVLALAIFGVLNLTLPDGAAPSSPARPPALGAPPRAYIPPSVDADTRRRLSLDLGGGACKWEPPEYEVPEDIDFFKTLIVGFPSCDKRMTFTQMEALTGWPARDEWDFVFHGGANHPFIKSNYPHHEGYWSWGTRADQVVLVVRNMRRTMVEYHDILWDIATVKNSPGKTVDDILYRYRPWPLDQFFEWRDLRVMDEIKWYGWFIDYWMEGGLLRDIFGNREVDAATWPYYPDAVPRGECVNDKWHASTVDPNTCTNDQIVDPPTPPPTMVPSPYPTRPPTLPPTNTPSFSPTPHANWTNATNATTQSPTPEYVPAPPPTPPPTGSPVGVLPTPNMFDTYVECCAHHFPAQQCWPVDVCPTPSPTPAFPRTYDEHCDNSTLEISGGCKPVAVVSAERLRDMIDGPGETVAIANTLAPNDGINQYLISSDAWQCIWDELIVNGHGNRMVKDREGYSEAMYNFSAPMLEAMIDEYDRLINKYNTATWLSLPDASATSVRLVQILMEHKGIIQVELDEVLAGTRRLDERDFLGPEERRQRRRLRAMQEGRDPNEEEFTVEEKREHFEYFMALEEKVKMDMRRERAREREEERKLAAKEKRKGFRKKA